MSAVPQNDCFILSHGERGDLSYIQFSLGSFKMLRSLGSGRSCRDQAGKIRAKSTACGEIRLERRCQTHVISTSDDGELAPTALQHSFNPADSYIDGSLQPQSSAPKSASEI